MMTQAVIAALDQGYGWTKGMCQVGGTNVYRGAFPSLAVPASGSERMGGLHRLRVQSVTVGGKALLVGVDAAHFTDGRNNDRQQHS